MATTPQMTEDRDARISEVLADVDRNRQLVEDSRRKRAMFQSRLRRSGASITRRNSRRGLFSWLAR
jgi:hypothetical protein